MNCPNHGKVEPVEELWCSTCRDGLFDCDHVDDPTEYVKVCPACGEELTDD